SQLRTQSTPSPFLEFPILCRPRAVEQSAVDTRDSVSLPVRRRQFFPPEQALQAGSLPSISPVPPSPPRPQDGVECTLQIVVQSRAASCGTVTPVGWQQAEPPAFAAR